MLDRHRLTLLTLSLLSAPLGACADDVGLTSASESTSTGASTGDISTTKDPTTVTPTTTVEPTTDPSTSTGPATVTDPSTSTGPATVTDPSTSTGPATTDTTDTTASTGSTTGGTTGDTGSSSSSTGGPIDCPIGEVNCDCDGGSCNGMATCQLGKCLPIGDGSCPFEFDFECDVPEFCPEGSDPFDCCATIQDGNCEEFAFGGMCAPYSDFYDCGYCLYENDNECDAPGLCPAGSDVGDCCATDQNGVCEEMQFGGMCPDGSDPYDCGICPTEGNGICDVPIDCPDGTDTADCCAHPKDGACEEMQFGGLCTDGSDFYDCGYCIYEDDDECDVPQFCPEGSDKNDCCAHVKDGNCEEIQFGGTCKNGSDFYDCGVCPYENDDECDVPQFCPVGTDAVDCCAHVEDGNCEEMQFGGQCTDGSDFYDCGYCIYEDDFECDVPQFCPVGTDVNDCA